MIKISNKILFCFVTLMLSGFVANSTMALPAPPQSDKTCAELVAVDFCRGGTCVDTVIGPYCQRLPDLEHDKCSTLVQEGFCPSGVCQDSDDGAICHQPTVISCQTPSVLPKCDYNTEFCIDTANGYTCEPKPVIDTSDLCNGTCEDDEYCAFYADAPFPPRCEPKATDGDYGDDEIEVVEEDNSDVDVCKDLCSEGFTCVPTTDGTNSANCVADDLEVISIGDLTGGDKGDDKDAGDSTDATEGGAADYRDDCHTQSDDCSYKDTLKTYCEGDVACVERYCDETGACEAEGTVSKSRSQRIFRRKATRSSKRSRGSSRRSTKPRRSTRRSSGRSR